MLAITQKGLYMFKDLAGISLTHDEGIIYVGKRNSRVNYKYQPHSRHAYGVDALKEVAKLMGLDVEIIERKKDESRKSD